MEGGGGVFLGGFDRFDTFFRGGICGVFEEGFDTFFVEGTGGAFWEGVEMAFRGVTFLVMGVFYCVKVVRGECGAMV